MTALQLNREGVLGLWVCCLVASGLQACGSSGGGGAAKQNTQPAQINTPTRVARSATPTRPGATSTRGPSVTPTRPGPSDTPAPPQPSDTPTPEPTEPAEIIVRDRGGIAAAVRRAPDGATIIVSPGTYTPVVLGPGDVQGSITIFADVTGEFTDSVPAPVVIDARGAAAALSLSGVEFELVIDGVTLRGGTEAGALLVRSPGVVLANCTVTRNGGDGIRVERSDDSLVFNNLVWNNSGAGIRVLATTEAFVINNTVYQSLQNGLSILNSPSAVVENNIFNKNVPAGIAVDAASVGYEADFNLNTDGYGAGTPAGVHDYNDGFADPQFIFPGGGDFHLAQTSVAIDGGDLDTDADLAAALGERTTQTDGTLDSEPVDLGYHYLPPVVVETPTRAPTRTPTRTPTTRPTATRTPTPRS
jgi:parallel beta-helix repeat protein